MKKNNYNNIMETHKCNICLKSFTCGKVLGCHMRSHIVNHVNQPNSEEQETEGIFSIQSSSSSRVKENLDFRDEDSEKECSNKAVPVRSIERKFKEQSVGLITDETPDEDIAYCLMMLKRDSWNRREKPESGAKLAEPKPSTSTKVRVKYKCDTCCKVFRSYQALGGHRVSHKKELIANRGWRTEERGSRERSGKKTHRCVVYLMSFSSGQALGGHKRSHVSGLEANYRVDSPIKNVNSMIDLNLSPTIDDCDEISQQVTQS